MPELRWTLLILGALFIGGLALWEWRRQRLARGPQSAVPAPLGGHGGREGERLSPTFDGNADVSLDASSPTYAPARGVFREPTLTFPEVQVEVPVDSRDRFADPPVVELDDESLDRLKVEAGEAIDEFSEPSADEIDEPSPAEPMIPRLSTPAVAPTLAPADTHAAASAALRDSHRQGDWRAARELPASHESQGAERGDHDAGEPPVVRDPHEEPTTRFVIGEEEAPAQAAAMPFDADALSPIEPIVEWPDEDVRKIVALRLVASIGERFSGRAVRLALAAEGFALGKFDIFHKPGPDARAVLSAASLTKPGTFSLASMDAQRFGGLSLFAVLPGPLSPLATFDELLTTARSLNDRLRGALQDERGEPLTPMRSAAIREGLTAAASAAAPVVSAAAAPPVVGSPGNATSA